MLKLNVHRKPFSLLLNTEQIRGKNLKLISKYKRKHYSKIDSYTEVETKRESDRVKELKRERKRKKEI